MPAFSVLEPSERRFGAGDPAEQIVFLREKFSLAAFLFGPLWMLWRRLWVVLIAYVIAVGFIAYALLAIGVGWFATIWVLGLIQLLVGLEATTLRYWTRLRAGWRDRGVVIADDLDMAERRFFDSRALAGAVAEPVRMSVPAQPAAAPMAPSRPDIVGLFPEPGGGR